MVRFVGEGGAGGEEDNRLRALRGTRPHTVGYVRGRDQEQGEIECPCRRSARPPSVFVVSSAGKLILQLQSVIDTVKSGLDTVAGHCNRVRHTVNRVEGTLAPPASLSSAVLGS